jgi:hypothetical protein
MGRRLRRKQRRHNLIERKNSAGDKWITWRKKMWGQVNGVHDQERGAFQEVPEDQAIQYVTQGLADFGKVSLDRLRPAYELSASDIADGEKLTRERHEQWVRDHPELAPKPNHEPIGRHPAFPRGRVEGWGPF